MIVCRLWIFFSGEKYKLGGSTGVFNLVGLQGGWRVGSSWFWSGVTLQHRGGGCPQAHPGSLLGRPEALCQSLPFLQKARGSVGEEGARDTLMHTCAGRASLPLTP